MSRVSPDPGASNPGSPAADRFLLCTCQGGAEAALRERVGAAMPAAHPGAWRKGLVTFRLPAAAAGQTRGAAAAEPGTLPADLVFPLAVIESVGQVTGGDDAARVRAALLAAAGLVFDTIHVWKRDPKADLPVAEIRAALLAASGIDGPRAAASEHGMVALDCVLDSAERWWVGWHRIIDPASRWPGGIYPKAVEPLPEAIVSRAWLKLDEAIAVFGIPFEAGQRAIELGASPGGACQRLLEAGLQVVGVDPALVDERVAVAPGFEQWRMRAREVPLRRCVGFDWLLADMNIDPSSTMAALGRIATAAATGLTGIVATLKLPSWSRAAELPGWLASFRSWGFEPRARQLSSSGREICVVAVRPPAARRSRRVGPVSRRPARRRPGR